jgi:hypothetical protein
MIHKLGFRSLFTCRWSPFISTMNYTQQPGRRCFDLPGSLGSTRKYTACTFLKPACDASMPRSASPRGRLRGESATFEMRAQGADTAKADQVGARERSRGMRRKRRRFDLSPPLGNPSVRRRAYRCIHDSAPRAAQRACKASEDGRSRCRRRRGRVSSRVSTEPREPLGRPV